MQQIELRKVEDVMRVRRHDFAILEAEEIKASLAPPPYAFFALYFTSIHLLRARSHHVLYYICIDQGKALRPGPRHRPHSRPRPRRCPLPRTRPRPRHKLQKFLSFTSGQIHRHLRRRRLPSRMWASWTRWQIGKDARHLLRKEIFAHGPNTFA